ncbi:MAG: gephyrin-like molybdotransferase Glp, partial [Planctomycetota bacterium]
MKQTQFLDVVSREEASRRFKEAVAWTALGSETVALANALYRVLGEDIAAPVDVPGFTRSNMDGFAVRAKDTFGASEEAPITLTLTGEHLGAGVVPEEAVTEGVATVIATGGVVPRGADAVVMIEDCDVEGSGVEGGALIVRRAVAPGANLAHAGSDIARGEVVLREGCTLSSRETGVLAALGLPEVRVVKKPRVTLFSTGDELLAPGAAPRDGFVFDSNSRILADAVREAGGQVFERGFLPDDEAHLSGALKDAIDDSDLLLLSGGTSKGAGDLSYRVLEKFGEIVVHGVALKPGKPIVLARAGDTPVVILPGFPTSAVFTFHEFVAPWIRARAGRMERGSPTKQARLARAVTSVKGRTEFDLVHLIDSDEDAGGKGGLVAYPLGKGSGSVTTFSRADGFYRIPSADERREAGESVEVTLLGDLHRPDLTVIGSHCTGLDLLLSDLRARG